MGNINSQGYSRRGHGNRDFGRGYRDRHVINNIDVRDVGGDFTDQEWEQLGHDRESYVVHVRRKRHE